MVSDVILVVGLCVFFGGIAGVVSVWYRRQNQHTTHRLQLFQEAFDLIENLQSSRFSEILIAENAHAAQTLGFDWFNPQEWPDDEEGIRLLALAIRAEKLETKRIEFANEINRANTSLKKEDLVQFVSILDIVQDYIDRVRFCIDHKKISDENYTILFRPQNNIHDPVQEELGLLRVGLIRLQTTDTTQIDQADEIVERIAKSKKSE